MVVVWWDNYCFMCLMLCFWQQGDKCLFQGLVVGLGFEFCGVVGCQYFVGVYCYQLVKLFGFFYVGGGYQYVYCWLVLVNIVDKFLELCLGEGIDVSGWFIKDQQLWIVDQCVVQVEFLFYFFGEFFGGVIVKWCQFGILQQFVDVQFVFGFIVVEQVGEEVDVFIY